MSKITDKVFISSIALLLAWGVLSCILFIKKFRFRIFDWSNYSFISTSVFVSYMGSSMFGNSRFATSPLIMIFMGLMVAEAMSKKSLLIEEKINGKK